MDDNEAMFGRVLDDEEFRQTLMELCATRVYRRARGDSENVFLGIVSPRGYVSWNVWVR